MGLHAPTIETTKNGNNIKKIDLYHSNRADLRVVWCVDGKCWRTTNDLGDFGQNDVDGNIGGAISIYG